LFFPVILNVIKDTRVDGVITQNLKVPDSAPTKLAMFIRDAGGIKVAQNHNSKVKTDSPPYPLLIKEGRRLENDPKTSGNSGSSSSLRKGESASPEERSGGIDISIET
jgi:hypothetical protein